MTTDDKITEAFAKVRDNLSGDWEGFVVARASLTRIEAAYREAVKGADDWRHQSESVEFEYGELEGECHGHRRQLADTLAFLERYACQGDDCKSGECKTVGDPRSLYCQHRQAANKLRSAIAGERHDPLVETL